MRDPGLAPGHAIDVTVELRASGQRGRIRARVALREAVGAQGLPREHPGKPLCDLLVVSGGRHGEACEGVHADADADRQPGTRKFLKHLEVHLVRLTTATHVLRKGQRQQPGSPKDAQFLAREARVLFGLGGNGRQLSRRDLPCQAEELAGLIARQQTGDLHDAAQSTITRSRGRLLSMIGPSAPQATMSSMRAPHRPSS